MEAVFEEGLSLLLCEEGLKHITQNTTCRVKGQLHEWFLEKLAALQQHTDDGDATSFLASATSLPAALEDNVHFTASRLARGVAAAMPGDARATTDNAPADSESSDNGLASLPTLPPLLLEFLFLCEQNTDRETLNETVSALIHFAVANRTAAEQTPASADTESAAALEEVDALLARYASLEGRAAAVVGNACQSFHLWLFMCWTCLELHEQFRLSATYRKWSAALKTRAKAEPFSRTADKLEEAPRTDEKGGLEMLDLRDSRAYIMRICEGQGEGSAEAAGFLASSLRGDFFKPAVHRLLERIEQGHASLIGGAAAGRDNVSTTQPILLNIATSLLVYVQFYLSLRALDTAQLCAQLSVLVAHQIHSDALLALAHYSTFLVHLCSGAPIEAASSIAVALQTVRGSGTSRGSTVAGGVSAEQLVSLGAAELLLYYPGVVSRSLRELIVTDARVTSGGGRGTIAEGDAAGVGNSATNDEDDDPNSADPLVDGHLGEGGSATAAIGGGGSGRTMTEQTVAQTLRYLLDSVDFSVALRGGGGGRGRGGSGSALGDCTHQAARDRYGEMAGVLTRERLLVAASVYGVTSSPRSLHVRSLGAMLRWCSDAQESNSSVAGRPARRASGTCGSSPRAELKVPSTRFTRQAQQPPLPPTALLREMALHTAHRSLAIQDGLLEYPASGVGPVGLVQDLVAAVRTHIGAEGVHFLNNNLFFVSVLQYLHACTLANRARLHDSLTTLCDVLLSLYHCAGLDHLAGLAAAGATIDATTNSSSSTTVQCIESSAALQQQVSNGGCCYFPPEHLFLYATVQLKRAEVAQQMRLESTLGPIAEALLCISNRFRFPYGVLVARLIAALRVRNNFNDFVRLVGDIRRRADSIGYAPLAVRLTALMASAQMAAGAWFRAMRSLEAVHHIPHHLTHWLVLSRINTGLELLLRGCSGTDGAARPSSQSTPSFGSRPLVLFAVESACVLQRLGLVLPAQPTAQATWELVDRLLEHRDSCGVSLATVVSGHCTLLRLVLLLAEEVAGACENESDEDIGERSHENEKKGGHFTSAAAAREGLRKLDAAGITAGGVTQTLSHLAQLVKARSHSEKPLGNRDCASICKAVLGEPSG